MTMTWYGILTKNKNLEVFEITEEEKEIVTNDVIEKHFPGSVFIAMVIAFDQEEAIRKIKNREAIFSKEGSIFHTIFNLGL